MFNTHRFGPSPNKENPAFKVKIDSFCKEIFALMLQSLSTLVWMRTKERVQMGDSHTHLF